MLPFCGDDMISRLLWVCFLTVASPLPLAMRDSYYGRMDESLQTGYEEELSTEDVFSQILKTNKDSTVKLYHGDIVMAAHNGFSAMKCTDCLWTKSSDGTVRVPYTISSDYNDNDKAFIVNALQDFSTLTCVQLVERSTEVDYLNIGSGSGCWSSVGKIGGPQYLSVLKTGCMARGIIQHEILHSLGFFHEQSRSDRDNYIDVLWEYINEGDWGNFKKEDTENMDLPFDYSSVMHYGKYAYSNTSGQPTLRPKPDQNVEIGQRYGLSPLDVSKVKKLYECNQCSFMLTGTGGSLDSDKYITDFSDSTSCLWLITSENNKVLLEFNTFDIPPSAGCSSYYITVYDGRSRKSPVLMDRVCGSKEFPLLVANTNGLLVEFAYEATLPVFDFKATYSSVACGGTYTDDNGTITSPDYPNLYPNFADCVSVIWAPEGFQILLNFTTFDLEYSSSCLYDYLIINDGGRPSAPELGRFCWDVHIPPILSTGNALLLQFHTDSWFNRAGYRADYSFVRSS